MNKFLKIKSKKNKSKIICLTAYSKNIASIIDKHCDIVLVGDSLGSVLYNFPSTKKVTLDMMIEHSKSVRMGVKKALMVVDMPHNTYRNPKEALRNAKKIISKTKCDAVKVEGGKKVYQIIKILGAKCKRLNFQQIKRSWILWKLKILKWPKIKVSKVEIKVN